MFFLDFFYFHSSTWVFAIDKDFHRACYWLIWSELFNKWIQRILIKFIKNDLCNAGSESIDFQISFKLIHGPNISFNQDQIEVLSCKVISICFSYLCIYAKNYSWICNLRFFLNFFCLEFFFFFTLLWNKVLVCICEGLAPV